MKKLLYLSFSILLLSCGEKSAEEGKSETGSNSITGKIENGSGKKIYLEEFTADGTIKLDSATIGNDGSFSVKAPFKTSFYRLGFDATNYILLALDSTDKKVNISASADTLSIGYSIEGSAFSKDVLEFVTEQTTYIKNRQRLVSQVTPELQSDTSFVGPLQRSAFRLDAAFNSFVVNFVDKHPKSPATFLALPFLDPINNLDVIKNVEKALAATMYNSPLHIDLLNKIGQFESQKQIQDAQLAEQERMTGHLKNGSPAPEINLPRTNGGNLALSSLKGKIVLIDFWASWCNPCRAENPNVVRLYKKYKDKGFTVYSVSLDKDKNKWLAAIKQDGLEWPNHVSDLKFWQCQAAVTYGVTSIPFTVLIDKEGNIIDKNLRGADLEQKLKELLGS